MSLTFLAKKGCFFSFEKEKCNFTTFASPWKNLYGLILEKYAKLMPPPGKNPSDAHDF